MLGGARFGADTEMRPAVEAEDGLEAEAGVSETVLLREGDSTVFSSSAPNTIVLGMLLLSDEVGASELFWYADFTSPTR